MKQITCFLLADDAAAVAATVAQLRQSPCVARIFLLSPNGTACPDCQTLSITDFASSDTMALVAAHADTDYALLYTKSTPLALGQRALERMAQVAADTDAGLLYTDYYAQKGDELLRNPTIDYQLGSVRDDFNFGSLLLFDAQRLKQAVATSDAHFRFAGWYDLRLRLSEVAPIVRLPEFLYIEVEQDARRSGQKQFDYVDPKNRAVQIEMEQVCTAHLKRIRAYLAPDFAAVDFAENDFAVEASVIIPVRNRVSTIDDAIRSVLAQKTTFAFNLIIIDNHSTDGTSELIEKYTNDSRVVHLVPARNDLGIGARCLLLSRCR